MCIHDLHLDIVDVEKFYIKSIRPFYGSYVFDIKESDIDKTNAMEVLYNLLVENL